jgi:hypothetical protein
MQDSGATQKHFCVSNAPPITNAWPMNFKLRTLAALSERKSTISDKYAIVGFDGFLDKIVTPVALRNGQGDDFIPIQSIAEFGHRILGAAGKSTNIELYPKLEKIGGNGPLMGNGLLAAGTKLKYIGALGAPHPSFVDFATRSDAVTLCEPGITTALEFRDGKLMLGTMTSLDEINYERIVEKIGGEPVLIDLFSKADLVALVNWTMIPNMTAIFERLTNVIPHHPTSKKQRYFFDLADPEKRSSSDLREALRAIARFEGIGSVTLGLNLKEAQHLHTLLGFNIETEDANGLKKMASDIREELRIDTVVIHPRESAACATSKGNFYVPGPFCEKPFTTTGAGDHFNAGFCVGQLLDLDPECCLTLAVAASGHYVRTGHSPSLLDLQEMLTSWV